MANPSGQAPLARRGLFITLEGGEGAGKSTQQRLLFNHLRSLNMPAITAREPGGTAMGVEIRGLLLELRDEPPAPWAELMLYLADRAQHVAEVIAPALKRGQTVICDRFIDSSEVYQGVARGLDQTRVRRMNQWVCGEVWPDLTILLDLEPEHGLKRALERQGLLGLPLDRLEGLGLDFHRALRRGFLASAAAEPQRIKVVDAAGTEEQVAQAIWAVVKQILETQAGHGL
jgi:dTMP kinase